MAGEVGEPQHEVGWPVSVKGVLGWEDRYVVLRNHRQEWELPGGRLDPEDGDLPSTLRREVAEELGLEVTVGALLDTWIYDVAGRRVVIVTYRCLAPRPPRLVISDEHVDVAVLALDELRGSMIPAGYLRSIETVAGGPPNPVIDDQPEERHDV